jgi:hypothetical protein
VFFHHLHALNGPVTRRLLALLAWLEFGFAKWVSWDDHHNFENTLTSADANTAALPLTCTTTIHPSFRAIREGTALIKKFLVERRRSVGLCPDGRCQTALR